MSGFKSMHVDSSACVRVKLGESERFRVDSRVRLLFHVPLALHSVHGWSKENYENGDGENGSETERRRMKFT